MKYTANFCHALRAGSLWNVSVFPDSTVLQVSLGAWDEHALQFAHAADLSHG